MSRIAIPPASLERLRASFTNFEQLAQVVSEAMGLGPDISVRIDLAEGAFFIDENQVPQVPEPERTNGVAALTADRGNEEVTAR